MNHLNNSKDRFEKSELSAGEPDNRYYTKTKFFNVPG